MGRCTSSTRAASPHEAVAKSRKAVRAALRRGAEHVYVTGCATRLGADALGGRGRARDGRARDRGGGGGAHRARARRHRLRRARRRASSARAHSSRCRTAARSAARSASSREYAARAAHGRSAPCSKRRAGASAQGHRELVVTGVNLGLYRDPEARAKLPDVIRALAELDGIARVRLSSIEVNHLTRQLCESLAHPRVCPHLHVPLQSGDDAVLRAMRRRYDLATYARRIELARRRVPGPQPHGRRDRRLPRRGRPCLRAHARGRGGARRSRACTCSRTRRGRARARRMPIPVPPAVKRRRAERLRALSDRLGRARREARVGRSRPRPDRARGCRWSLARLRCRLHRVRVAAMSGAGVGDLVEVEVEAAGERAALGRVL